MNYKRNRYAFTLLELVFVIVIMGILGKFGVEFLAQAYNNFIFASVNNTLQSRSASAVESIASRLQYRIKDSVIARDASGNFQALAGSTLGSNARVLEWVGSDIDGFRGDAMPLWSGIIDIDPSLALGANTLVSPMTDTNATNALIDVLSDTDSGINDAALYFVGSDNDIGNYGWGGAVLTNHMTAVMHPISNVAGNADRFVSGIVDDFDGVDVYEYYKLAWTAYAVVHNTDNGDLTLHYDYQPWNGETFNDGKSSLLMENVDTFRFKANGSVIKIQVCTATTVMENYSLCKEKTIF